MKTICPHCKQEFPETPDEYLGMTFECPVCKEQFVCKKVMSSLELAEMYAKRKKKRLRNRRALKKESRRISEEAFKNAYRDLRDYRRENYSKKYGITVRDGRAYSIYNPLERIRQSRVADFIRAGGIRYIGNVAIDFVVDVCIAFRYRLFND